MGAEMRLGPSEDFDIYKVASNDYNAEILISGVCDNGWVKYQYWYSSGLYSDRSIDLYIAPEDVIWDESDAYTISEYKADATENGTKLWDEEAGFVKIMFGLVGVKIITSVFWCIFSSIQLIRKGSLTEDEKVSGLSLICTIMEWGIGAIGLLTCLIMGHLTMKGFLIMVAAVVLSCVVDTISYVAIETIQTFLEREEENKCENS